MIAHAASFAQINLVTNPSFEEISFCPNFGGQINKAIGWSTLINGGGGTPDLYHVCCTNPSKCGVPSQSSFHTFQYPHSGNSYSGIQVLASNDINYREYIQSKLKKGLSVGHIYCIKFYISLSDQNTSYIKPFGAYLDSGEVISLNTFGLAYANSMQQLANPQTYNSVLLLNDTINWIKIEGSFTATGIETYITLGNFFPDSLSDIEFFGTPTLWMSYYYIDDISVIDANLPANAGNDTLIYPGDSVFIGRQPEIGLDEDCIWLVSGLPIDTIAGMWVKPDSTTTYVLEQTICGNVSWDTVTVSVYGTGIAGYFNEAAFRIYPNPATHLLQIESPVTKAIISITNLLGQEVLRQEVSEKQFSMDVSKLGKGVYFLLMKTEKGVFVRKFLKE